MNYALLKEIVNHVMLNFGVVPSDFMDHKRSGSLLEPIYLLSDKIYFESEGIQHSGKIWGCQMSVSTSEIKVLLGECTLDPEFPEWAMVIQSKGGPSYGLYLCYNELSDHPRDSEPDLTVSTNGKEWMQCNTFLQATFLGGMEYLRELHMPWSKCTDHKDLYQSLLSFVNHHHTITGD